MRIPRLHVLTDATLGKGHGHLALARAAITGGADAVQLRQKSGDDDSVRPVAEAIATECATAGVTLLIDDRVDLAAELGAGAHVGQDDMPPRLARRRLGRHRLLGATANTLEMLLALAEEPIDYIGLGPAFATTSKQGAPPPLGLTTIATWIARTRHPVVAIGGVTAAHIPALQAAGAHGVAVLGAVADADDPREAVRLLRRSLR